MQIILDVLGNSIHVVSFSRVVEFPHVVIVCKACICYCSITRYNILCLAIIITIKLIISNDHTICFSFLMKIDWELGLKNKKLIN